MKPHSVFVVPFPKLRYKIQSNFPPLNALKWTNVPCVTLFSMTVSRMFALLLSVIAMSGVEDVRPVLDHYRQFDDPLSAFKEKHEQLMVRFTLLFSC